MATSERFTIYESTALLHAIFPGYPDLRGMKPTPDASAFLLALRSGCGKSQDLQLTESADGSKRAPLAKQP
jgi:hypothetical protein